jgi:hypothetical protein
MKNKPNFFKDSGRILFTFRPFSLVKQLLIGLAMHNNLYNISGGFPIDGVLISDGYSITPNTNLFNGFEKNTPLFFF